jgi:hypothetical protein
MSSTTTAPAAWANELAVAWESGAHSQFILYGNIHDRLIHNGALVNLLHYLDRALLGKFAIVLHYDLGNGLRIERGGDLIATWQRESGVPPLPRQPLAALEWINHLLRYYANLQQLGRAQVPQIACVVRGIDQIIPATGQAAQQGALSQLLRDWASEEPFSTLPFVSLLLADNLADLQPLIGQNPRSDRLRLPLPDSATVAAALAIMAKQWPKALPAASELTHLASGLTGVTLLAIEGLIRRRHHAAMPLMQHDLLHLKKGLVESEAGGLIDFIFATRTLDDYHGQPHLITTLRQDMALWRQGDLRALPKGYLIVGPVGTGKSYLVECLAGEAGVPVVKLKNFRDRWVGSSEGNLETIFRLVRGLGRCLLFIDEADQSLGRRDSGGNDGGLSGRIYAMLAEEMGSSETRGRVIWILASSRPDLIEVDLKRPGRVDIKVPILPTVSTSEGQALLSALLAKYGIKLNAEAWLPLIALIPNLLTPGAAEAIAVKCYRLMQLEGISAAEAVNQVLDHWQPPIATRVMEQQMRLAIRETSDLAFVPPPLRHLAREG